MQKQSPIGATCKDHTRARIAAISATVDAAVPAAVTAVVAAATAADCCCCCSMPLLFLPLRMLRLHSSEEEAKADDMFL